MKEADLLKILGANIKQQRQRLEWSQEKLAEKINISITFLSDVENGKKCVSLTTLLKLSNAFDIEAYELLTPEFSQDIGKKLLGRYIRDINYSVNRTLIKVQEKYIPA